MSKIKLEVWKPEGLMIDAEFDQVVVPGSEGDFGVLPDHTPFITKLRPGVVLGVNGEKHSRWAVHDGFVTVEDNVVRIACEVAENAVDIDTARAHEAQKRAEERLRVKTEDTDFRRAEAALHRAVARIHAVQGESEL